MVGPAKILRGRSEQLTVGITQEMAARKPKGFRANDTVTVNCNHASFVFGHLALYPARMLERLGLETTGAKPPESWDGLFKAGVECLDDASGTIYPAFEELKALYFRATDLAFERILSGVTDAMLEAAPSDERPRAMFGTNGAMLNFMLNNHVGLHMGQLSTWRRCMGLGSVE
jgi:hypothetical protein